MNPVKKTVKKTVPKKTTAKPKGNANLTAKPKGNANLTAKPKRNANLKKGGLAPGSKQVQISKLKSTIKYNTDSDWSANHPIKSMKEISKAQKELRKIYKSLGYPTKDTGPGSGFGYRKSDKWKA